mmetsp:Transcript_39175/g.65035  ORF Transcript_39175/g.65035 Transcript_39175/m.65035 type:complete len:226 (-) Transcript_39175:1425-2102(-)
MSIMSRRSNSESSLTFDMAYFKYVTSRSNICGSKSLVTALMKGANSSNWRIPSRLTSRASRTSRVFSSASSSFQLKNSASTALSSSNSIALLPSLCWLLDSSHRAKIAQMLAYRRSISRSPAWPCLAGAVRLAAPENTCCACWACIRSISSRSASTVFRCAGADLFDVFEVRDCGELLPSAKDIIGPNFRASSGLWFAFLFFIPLPLSSSPSKSRIPLLAKSSAN